MSERRSRLVSTAAVLAIAMGAVLGFGAEDDSPFARRRTRLMETVKDGVILVPSQARVRQGFRASADFYYLTGLMEPEVVLCLVPGDEPRQILFRGRKDPTGEPPGPRPDPEPLVYPGLVVDGLEQMGPALRRAATRFPKALFPFSDLEFLIRALGAVNPFAQAETFHNLGLVTAEMRMVKDAGEIQALRKAVDITAEGLKEAYRAAEPGVKESDLAAAMKSAFARHGTEESFLQAASGPNATNVHFGATERILAAGDMIVFDVGVWHNRYTADISRTIPASGRLSKAQREIYELVLEAQKEGCRRLVPGVTFKKVQDAVEDILMEGLTRLGLVTDPKSPWQRRLHIQHGFGHGIGLDIHDSWGFHAPRLDKIEMTPGMVMTMEPGLYFPEKRFESFLASLEGKVAEEEIEAFAAKVGPVYKKYVNIGVRIEDDILITANGNEILSVGVPKEIPEIEKLMREERVKPTLRHF